MNEKSNRSKFKVGPITITAKSHDGKSAEEILESAAKDEAAIAYTNHELWEFQARQLTYSAELLRKEEKHKVDQIPDMLYGLAIEVSLKGLLIKNRKPKLDQNYHLIRNSDLDRITNSGHNLEKLFRLNEIDLLDNEKQVAYKLTNIVENYGKYPSAKPSAGSPVCQPAPIHSLFGIT